MEPKEGNLSARYGLRYFNGSEEIRLLEISGGGRIRVGLSPNTRRGHPAALSIAEIEWLYSEPGSGVPPTGRIKHEWWCKRPIGVRWEPYKTSDGQTYADEESALRVARNLEVHAKSS